MAGGLESRLLREKIRGEKMLNAEQMMNVGRPTGMLQDLLLAQGLQRPEQMMEMQRMQQVPDTLRVLGEFMDPSELALNFLQQMGIQGQAQPLQGQNLGMVEDPQLAEFRRMLQEKMQQQMMEGQE